MSGERKEYGIVVALVTPLDEDESLDVASLENVLEWVLASGAKGVFLAGTMGEGLALRDAVRRKLFGEAVRIVRGRMTVLANVSESGTLRAIDLAAEAARRGVDAVVATPRSGMPQRRSGETRYHLRAIAEASPVPVWFYENPVTTQVTSSFETLRDLAEVPNVTGLKYSGSDRDLYARCVKEFPARFPVMTGNVGDIAYAGYLGASGAVSGIGSLLPGLCARVFAAARAGRRDEAERLQKALDGAYVIYGGAGMPFWPSAQKHALKRRGILRTSVVCAPFLPLAPEDEARIDAALALLDPGLFDPARPEA
jgi:4-hydroxy-tetrahydrodipicolinate synthase